MIFRVVHVEWMQWWARRDVRLSLVFVVVAAVLWSWVATLAVKSGVMPVNLFGAEETGFAVGHRSAQSLSRLVMLLVLLWASASVASDVETGSIRTHLLRVRRRELLVGKLLQLWLAAVALLVIVWLICVSVGAAFLGLESIEISGLSIHSVGGLLGTGLAAALLTSLPAAALIALGVTLSAIAPGSRGATTLTILVVVVFWGVGLFEPFSSWLFVSALDRPWSVAVAQAEGLRTMSHFGNLLQLVTVSVLWTISLLALATWQFDRRDLP